MAFLKMAEPTGRRNIPSGDRSTSSMTVGMSVSDIRIAGGRDSSSLNPVPRSPEVGPIRE